METGKKKGKEGRMYVGREGKREAAREGQDGTENAQVKGKLKDEWSI